jgi:hypothetical protein
MDVSELHALSCSNLCRFPGTKETCEFVESGKGYMMAREWTRLEVGGFPTIVSSFFIVAARGSDLFFIFLYMYMYILEEKIKNK